MAVHTSLADGVLIHHIDPNRTDIAVYGEKNAPESASQSEAEEEEVKEEEEEDEEENHSKDDCHDPWSQHGHPARPREGLPSSSLVGKAAKTHLCCLCCVCWTDTTYITETTRMYALRSSI